jgi:hypothetical protein
MEKTFSLILLILITNFSCTPGIMKCFLDFEYFNKTFEFDFSKEYLKNKIVESYSYNESFLLKNLGVTLIENEQVNSKYQKSVNIWLDKNNWDKFKSEIRNNTTDTLNIIIGKQHSRKEIKFTAIVKGDDKNSSLELKKLHYQKRNNCKKEKDYYLIKLSKKIEGKFIEKLK